MAKIEDTLWSFNISSWVAKNLEYICSKERKQFNIIKTEELKNWLVGYWLYENDISSLRRCLRTKFLINRMNEVFFLHSWLFKQSDVIWKSDSFEPRINELSPHYFIYFTIRIRETILWRVYKRAGRFSANIAHLFISCS